MATNYPQFSTQGSLSEVLKLVVLEHRELRAQHRDVSARIRNLRIAVRTLRNLGGKRAGVTRREDGTATDAGSDLGMGENGIEQKVANADAAESQSTALRRAVRIAVCETFDVVSSEEVYLRILRRGSFRFSNQDLAAGAIGGELNAMAEQGELLRIDTAEGSGWQRITT